MKTFKSYYVEQNKHKKLIKLDEGVIAAVYEDMFSDDSFIDKLMLMDIDSNVIYNVYAILKREYTKTKHSSIVKTFISKLKKDEKEFDLFVSKHVNYSASSIDKLILKYGLGEYHSILFPLFKKIRTVIINNEKITDIYENIGLLGIKELQKAYKAFVNLIKPKYISSNFNTKFLDLVNYVCKHNDITVNDLVEIVKDMDGDLIGIDHDLNPEEYEELLSGLNLIARNRIV